MNRGYAYLAGGYNGFRVIDISNPYSPVEVGGIDRFVLKHEKYLDTLVFVEKIFDVSERYAYAMDEYLQTHVIDVSEPHSPREVCVDSVMFPVSLAVSDSYAYVGTWGKGLRVMDLSNPCLPVTFGKLDIPGWAFSLAVAENYACLADERGGFHVVDVASPHSPVEIGYMSMPCGARTVAASKKCAAVVDECHRLRLVDLSKPNAPREVFVDSLMEAWDVDLLGDFAYVASGAGGLHVLHVARTCSLEVAGHLDTPGWAQSVAVSNGYVYIADKHEGLQVIDASDPSSPVDVACWRGQRLGYGTRH